MDFKNIMRSKLKSQESKEKYLDILARRIEENKRIQGRLIFAMLLAVIAFPLLLEAKISEISFGPIKLSDTKIATMLIPTFFAFAYYQYQTILYSLSKQRVAYEILASDFFKVPTKSVLTKIVKPYSFTDVFEIHLKDENSKFLGCLARLFSIPSLMVVILFPFFFEFYTLKKILNTFGLNNFIEWILFIIPIILGFLTFLLIIQSTRKDLEEQNSSRVELNDPMS